LKEIYIHSVNGVHPAMAAWGSIPQWSLPHRSENANPCQMQFINCPQLEVLDISAMGQVTIELINLPSLSSSPAVSSPNGLNAAISIIGPTRLETAYFEFGKLCGTIADNSRGSRLLSDVMLGGNFSANEIIAFVKQHRDTLRKLRIVTRKFDPLIQEYCQSLTDLELTWVNGTIDAASYAKLHADKKLNGNEFLTVIAPSKEDVAANYIQEAQKIQIDKFVVSNMLIDDEAAQWLADNVQARELEVRRYGGDIEMLLPVVATDGCRLYISKKQYLDPFLRSTLEKYPKLIISLVKPGK
jgi:hypothetical protein